MKKRFVLFPSRCYNGGNKHKFESIYEESEIVHESSFEIPLIYSTPSEARLLLVKELYVADICAWCGAVVSRAKEENNHAM